LIPITEHQENEIFFSLNCNLSKFESSDQEQKAMISNINHIQKLNNFYLKDKLYFFAMNEESYQIGEIQLK
jgi:hypothetical protein